MKEIWKDIKGYEDFYKISNKGRVKSLRREVINNEGIRIVKEAFLKPRDNGKKYLYVGLCKSGLSENH